MKKLRHINDYFGKPVWAVKSPNRYVISSLLALYEFGYTRWFNVRIHGRERFPYSGPALLMADHHGAVATPALIMIVMAWYKLQGAEMPLHGVADPGFFELPALESLIRELGGIRNDPDQIRAVFRDGGFVLGHPGPEFDRFDDLSTRRKLEMFEKSNIIKVAIGEGIPIIPVVTMSSDETVTVETQRKKSSGLLGGGLVGKWLRDQVKPLSFSAPWGLTFSPLIPSIRLPRHMTIAFGNPIRFVGAGTRAWDPVFIHDTYGELRETMKEMAAVIADPA